MRLRRTSLTVVWCRSVCGGGAPHGIPESSLEVLFRRDGEPVESVGRDEAAAASSEQQHFVTEVDILCPSARRGLAPPSCTDRTVADMN